VEAKKMTSAEQQLADKLPEFEGSVAWPYLDTHIPPLVTVWIGNYIPLEDALYLPFRIGDKPATQAQIEAEYAKVQAMPGGMLAVHYQYDGCLMLQQDGGDALVEAKLGAFTQQLMNVFPAYATFPIGPQVGLLDLIYNVGLGGLEKYHHLIAAANANPPDWTTVAANCASNSSVAAFAERNEWRKEQISSAVESSVGG
jgi:hypothetical protein